MGKEGEGGRTGRGNMSCGAVEGGGQAGDEDSWRLLYAAHDGERRRVDGRTRQSQPSGPATLTASEAQEEEGKREASA
jgi:hypothetical protein